MDADQLRRYGPLAIGAGMAFMLMWWSTGSARGRSLTGLPAREPRWVMWSALAMMAGFALFVVLDRTSAAVLPAVALVGMLGVLVLAVVQVRRHPERPLPRTDRLLRWSIAVTLVLLALGFGIRALFGPGIPFALVGGLGLGMLPGTALLALFTLLIRVARRRN